MTNGTVWPRLVIIKEGADLTVVSLILGSVRLDFYLRLGVLLSLLFLDHEYLVEDIIEGELATSSFDRLLGDFSRESHGCQLPDQLLLFNGICF